jgi:O-antigen/teichoic acid export membrane protein
MKNSSFLFASYALGAVLTILTANLLGVAEFGLLGTITVFVSNINRLFSFRMGEVVVRYMGEALAQGDRPRAAAMVKAAFLIEAFTSLAAFAALAVLAPLGAQYFARDVQAAPLFMIYGISILMGACVESATGVLQVTNHFRSQAVINFVQAVLVALLLGLAAVYRADLPLVLGIYLIGKIILGLGPLVVALYWLPRALGPGWLRAPFSLLPPRRELVRFAISSNFSGTINLLARDSEIPIVNFFFGNAAAGYYKIALALINLIIMPINPFISTTYPEITRAFAARQWARLRSLLQRVTLISTGWTAVVTVGLLLVGRQLLFEPLTVLGRSRALLEGYLPAYPVLLILLAGYGIANIFFWNRPLLLAQGLADFPLKVSLAALLVKLALTPFLLPRFGYLMEAVLLSAFLLVTVGVSVWRGLSQVRRAARLSPETEHVCEVV